MEEERFYSHILLGKQRGGFSEVLTPGEDKRPHIIWKGMQRKEHGGRVWDLFTSNCHLSSRILQFQEYTIGWKVGRKEKVHLRHQQVDPRKERQMGCMLRAGGLLLRGDVYEGLHVFMEMVLGLH